RPPRRQAARPAAARAGARRDDRGARDLPRLLHRRAARGDRGAGLEPQPPLPAAHLHLHRDGDRRGGQPARPVGGGRSRGAPDAARARRRRDGRDARRARPVGDQRAAARLARRGAPGGRTGPPVQARPRRGDRRARAATARRAWRLGRPARVQPALHGLGDGLPLRVGRLGPDLGGRPRGGGADGAPPRAARPARAGV
ncbi:MAG: hypothetical protein AVDCRST_MAG30-2411, partial [uncultured Solirubrobacteraceae bacterium]